MTVGADRVSDTLVSAAIALTAAEDAATRAERERLDRLVARHETRREGLREGGTRKALERIGEMLAGTLSGRSGEKLSHRVGGPFGVRPEWYLSLLRRDGSTWSILKFVGRLDRLRIDREVRRGHDDPVPASILDLADLFQARHDEDDGDATASRGGA